MLEWLVARISSNRMHVVSVVDDRVDFGLDPLAKGRYDLTVQKPVFDYDNLQL